RAVGVAQQHADGVGDYRGQIEPPVAVEIARHDAGWGRAGRVARSACLRAFRCLGWTVDVAVLAYGRSPSGLEKRAENFAAEVRLLRALSAAGARLYQVQDLHAKGQVRNKFQGFRIPTPLPDGVERSTDDASTRGPPVPVLLLPA